MRQAADRDRAITLSAALDVASFRKQHHSLEEVFTNSNTCLMSPV